MDPPLRVQLSAKDKESFQYFVLNSCHLFMSFKTEVIQTSDTKHSRCKLLDLATVEWILHRIFYSHKGQDRLKDKANSYGIKGE